MGYDGGKAGAGVYQTIINEIPPHDVYVAACLGHDAVMRHKKPAFRNVGIDIDSKVVADWKGDEVPRLELHCCDGVEWLRHEFGLYRLPSPLLSATPPGSAAAVAQIRDVAGKSPALAIDAESGGLSSAAGTLFSAPKYFVYLDPPYPFSVRRSRAKIYRFEFTDDDHLRLLLTARLLPCMVAVSSYWNDVYATALADWRLVRFYNQTRKGRVEECLWMNYSPPKELHDSRFVGKNKRQRERIRRRCRNWSAALKRASSLERQAIMDTITGR